MNISRKHRIVAVVIGFFVTFLASSIKGSYQVYFLDLVKLFGQGRDTFALTGAVFGLVLGVVSPFVGWVCDRYGPAKTILTGAFSTVLAYLALSITVNFWGFMFLFGVLAAYALAAMTFVPLGLLIDKIFQDDQKGMAYAAITNGTSIGFMVLSPLWVWLNTFVPWQQISLCIAIAFLLVVVPGVMWLSRLFPNNASPQPGARIPDNNVLSQLRRPIFILLAISFAGCGASMAYIDVHLVPMMQERLSGEPTGAVLVASTLSILGAAELIGAFVVGWLLRFSAPAMLLAILYTLRTFSMLILHSASDTWHYLAFATVFGLTYMGTVIITSVMCLRCYGAEIKGKMFGFLFTVHQLMVFLTAWLGGMTYEFTQSYDLVTLSVMGFCMLSVFVGLILNRFEKKEVAPSMA